MNENWFTMSVTNEMTDESKTANGIMKIFVPYFYIENLILS